MHVFVSDSQLPVGLNIVDDFGPLFIGQFVEPFYKLARYRESLYMASALFDGFVCRIKVNMLSHPFVPNIKGCFECDDFDAFAASRD